MIRDKTPKFKKKMRTFPIMLRHIGQHSMFTHSQSQQVVVEYVLPMCQALSRVLGDIDEPSSHDSCLPGDYGLERDESYFQNV